LKFIHTTFIFRDTEVVVCIITVIIRDIEVVVCIITVIIRDTEVVVCIITVIIRDTEVVVCTITVILDSTQRHRNTHNMETMVNFETKTNCQYLLPSSVHMTEYFLTKKIF
jgi:putative N-acetylmannosamine-6-phosphate epimerase